MSKSFLVEVEINIDAEIGDSLLEMSDHVKYVRDALDYYQDQASASLYKVRASKPAVEQRADNSAMQVSPKPDRAVCRHCWGADSMCADCVNGSSFSIVDPASA